MKQEASSFRTGRCHGNHSSIETIVSVEEYDKEKQEHTLFNVERIQRAFQCLDDVVSKTTVQSIGSYGLKHVIERHQGEYITNGDCIAAMLVKGYIADFGSEAPHVNCQFTIGPSRLVLSLGKLYDNVDASHSKF